MTCSPWYVGRAFSCCVLSTTTLYNIQSQHGGIVRPPDKDNLSTMKECILNCGNTMKLQHFAKSQSNRAPFSPWTKFSYKRVLSWFDSLFVEQRKCAILSQRLFIKDIHQGKCSCEDNADSVYVPANARLSLCVCLVCVRQRCVLSEYHIEHARYSPPCRERERAASGVAGAWLTPVTRIFFIVLGVSITHSSY